MTKTKADKQSAIPANKALAATMIWEQLTPTQQTDLFQLLVKLCWQMSQTAAAESPGLGDMKPEASEESDEHR